MKSHRRTTRTTAHDRRKHRTRVKGLRRWVLVAVLLVPLLLALIVAGVVLFGLRAASALGEDAPQLDKQKDVNLAETSRIYAGDGTLLAYLHGVENRTVIGQEGIPQIMKDAIVAIEDRRFYEHGGVDFEGIARAAYKDLQAGGIVEGSSTITMQLVGSLYLDRNNITFTRKFQEAALAWQMESEMSKDAILDLYLNTIYFGANAYGVEAAARTYFDKDPSKLTLPEAALLAGLPQAPSAYSPRLHPEAARHRRDKVLLNMYAYGFIAVEAYEKAVNSPVVLAPASPYAKVQEPYVVAYVRKQLIDMFGEDMVFKGGLSVETTINPAYQKMAQQAIASTLDAEGDPSAALVAIEPRTGYIRAMASGSDYDNSKFNLAVQSRRQPGSTFKMFVLAAAVETGIDPFTTYYSSQPLELKIPGRTEPWKVEVYGGESYGGTMNIATATLRSDNTVYAQLCLDVSPERVVDVAKRMGITSTLNADPAIAIGGLTYGVSPLEMASAYGTLANQGQYVQPVLILRVKNSKGKVIWEAQPKVTQAISAGVANTVTKILEQNTRSGTATAARLQDRPTAGKTGTAQDWHDAWFCGYVPQLSAAVWMGHPEAQIPMHDIQGFANVTGGGLPAMIWKKFMEQAIKDYPVEGFVSPEGMVAFNTGWFSRYAVPPTTTSSSTTTSTTASTTSTTGPTTGTTGGTTLPPTTRTTAPPTTGTTAPPTTGTTTATTAPPPTRTTAPAG